LKSFRANKGSKYFDQDLFRKTDSEQGCQIFSCYNIPKTGKIYQMTITYPKWQQKIPNGRKMDQMDKKYANVIHCQALQNLPKFEFLVLKYAIWQL
jgi:hypothetical protein